MNMNNISVRKAINERRVDIQRDIDSLTMTINKHRLECGENSEEWIDEELNQREFLRGEIYGLIEVLALL